MSPRSVESCATKVTALSPDPIAPLSPTPTQQLPSHYQPSLPHAHIASRLGTCALGSMQQPATAALQGQNEAGAMGEGRQAEQHTEMGCVPPAKSREGTFLCTPFKAASLQKLADAALSCKKVRA